MQLENIKKISFLVAILLLFLAFVLLAGFFFENKALKEDKIILGVIAPISGSYSVWGNNELKGFELAKEELLSKGISNFDFVVEDSSGDSTKAVSSATKLLSEDGVDLLYTNFTGPAVAVAPLANDSNKIHLYEAASTSPAKAFPNNSIKIAYYLYESDCSVLGKVAKDNNFLRIAFIFAQKDFSPECKDGFLSNFKDAIVSEFGFVPSSEDFSTILAKVSAEGFDAILVTGYNADFGKLYRKMSELNLDIPVFCAGSEDCYSQGISDYSPQDVFFFASKVSSSFKEKMLLKYPDSSALDISIAAEAYDVAMFVSNAYLKCPSKEKNCLYDAITKSNISTVVQNKGFNKNMLTWDVELFKINKNN